MTRYRKRGAEVKAFQWNGALGTSDPAWFQELVTLGKIRRVCPEGPETARLYIDTPTALASLCANVGDWIVRNTRGDVFPMTEEKFAEMYEVVAP